MLGINQMQTKLRVGLAFASALKIISRGNPEFMMIGDQKACFSQNTL
jgi:type II secretory ATPase GspE/PulE/Tfp pilus assembly ATPase PilB-like protein